MTQNTSSLFIIIRQYLNVSLLMYSGLLNFSMAMIALAQSQIDGFAAELRTARNRRKKLTHLFILLGPVSEVLIRFNAKYDKSEDIRNLQCSLYHPTLSDIVLYCIVRQGK